ncbi:MAG TPA: hypothetical protein VGL42_15750 [Opitutaceae bacterium]|jgi:hypothetical protein
MNTNVPFPPALLEGGAFLVVALSIVVVAEHSRVFALAAREAVISTRAKRQAPALLMLGLAFWAGWAITLVTQPVSPVDHPGNPLLLLKMVPMMLASLVIMLSSKTVKAINAVSPPATLIRIQSYRMAGLMFLWPYLHYHFLPAGFAWPAGVGDALTGLAAPFVASALERGRPGSRGLALAWNYFGILDLIVAPTAAMLTHTTNIGLYPLVVIPLFVGPPMGILTHIYSLRNLAATGRQAISDQMIGARATTA